MFTGLIQAPLPVVNVSRKGEGLRLQINLGELSQELKIGDSVAVNGACLTVTSINGSVAAFDVVSETVAKTNLGKLRSGDKVNIELPLRVGDRLGGHFVQGHVDGAGTIAQKTTRQSDTLIRVETDALLTRMMVPKGSVAVDGISLTLVDVGEGWFSVALIPHTLRNTTFGFRAVGDEVNIEIDMIAKLVAKYTGSAAAGVTREMLEKYGFA